MPKKPSEFMSVPIGSKTAAMHAAERKRNETTSTYRDEKDRLVTATTHSECNGKGCERCGGLGFTSQYAAELFDAPGDASK